MAIGRRELAVLLAGAALARPRAGAAQQPALPTIGVLNSQSPETVAPLMAGFHEGLGEAGYAEGRNVAVEYHWALGSYDRLPELAAELVARGVAVIFAGGGSPSPLAAKAATSTIPIVFVSGSDPVALGLVPSLSRPGGNLTGATVQNDSIDTKRLEILHELLPEAPAFTALLNPENNVFPVQSRDLAEAARLMGVELRILTASSAAEIETAFATLAEDGAPVLLLGTDAFFTQDRRPQILALAAGCGIGIIGSSRDWATGGGLMAYGASLAGAYRQAGRYVGRVLGGEQPADLPVVQADTFDFVINLQTAAALDLTVPPGLLLRATELIE